MHPDDYAQGLDAMEVRDYIQRAHRISEEEQSEAVERGERDWDETDVGRAAMACSDPTRRLPGDIQRDWDERHA